MHLNVEIKAKCSDPERVRELLKAPPQNAEFKGVDHQIDTYFKLPSHRGGRLKLREGNVENSLIYYLRQDQEGPKNSNVFLHEMLPGSNLKEVLMAAYDTLVVVDKVREIYFIDNVKFHIDEVKDLGSFCEIEAIDTDGTFSNSTLLMQCERSMLYLGIKKEDLISCSYSDMLLEKFPGRFFKKY